MRRLASLLAFVSLLGIVHAGAEPLPAFKPAERQDTRRAQCARQGTLLISIASHVLSAPRNILEMVDDRGAFFIPCGTQRIEARSIFFRASTNSGKGFYDNWLYRERMPAEMMIEPAGRTINTTEKMMESARASGYPGQKSGSVETVTTKSTVYYRLERAKEPLFVQCSTTALGGKHICRVSYRLGDLDVWYRFYDNYSPQDDWVALDERFRQFVRKMEDDARAAR